MGGNLSKGLISTEGSNSWVSLGSEVHVGVEICNLDFSGGREGKGTSSESSRRREGETKRGFEFV